MNTTTYGGAYGAFEYGPICPEKPVDVMEIGGAVVWASRWSEMDDDLTWDLRIRLNDRFGDQSPLIVADERAQTLFATTPELFAVQYPPTISINWPDFGTPPLDKAWWQGLVKALSEMPKDSNVGLYCQGGHGRTGTALSILAYLSGNVPVNTDPVYWVRKNYCADAVESWAQIDYIQRLTGEEITSIPTSQIKHDKMQKAHTTSATLMDGWEKDAGGVWRKKPATLAAVKAEVKKLAKQKVAA